MRIEPAIRNRKDVNRRTRIGRSAERSRRWFSESSLVNYQPAAAVRVTIAETYLACSRGNLRISTVILDWKVFQQMYCEPIRQCLDEIGRLITNKPLRLLGYDGIVNRVADFVRHIARLPKWPKRNVDR